MEPRRPNSLRLPTYDYASAGAYFFTVCTKDRSCLFGDVVGNAIVLGPIGSVVAECWHEVPDHLRGVALDAFVVMPNHVHGIVFLGVGAGYIPPLHRVVALFKAGASRRAGRPL